MSEKIPTNPSDYTQDISDTVSEVYGSFELGGARVTAYLPAAPPDVWTVEIKQDGETFTHTLPMDYAPIFGPDVSDVQQLHEFIEVLIKQYNLE